MRTAAVVGLCVVLSSVACSDDGGGAAGGDDAVLAADPAGDPGNGALPATDGSGQPGPVLGPTAGTGGAPADPAAGVAPEPPASAADDGAGNTSPAAAEPALTECNGMALPPRAVAGAFDRRARPAGLEEYWPTDGFRSADPGELGLDAQRLEQAVELSTPGSNTQAVLVTRHGYVAREYYAGGFSASSRFESYSMAKSFSSTLIGILIDRGVLAGTDEPLCQFYDEWSCEASDPHSAITIDHAMNVSTGLQWTEDWRTGTTGGNDIFRAFAGVLDYTLARDVVDEPGTNMRYSTGDPALLSGVIQDLTGKSALEFAREVLFSQIGTPGIQWGSDGRGRTTTYAGLAATATEYAKFGYLLLRQGQWDGTQVVSSEWVAKATQGDAPCDDWYRYLWHQNPPIRLGLPDPDCPQLAGCVPLEMADLPPDTFFAEGINGQSIFVIPSADMVVVRLGNDSSGSEGWDTYSREFLGKILDSVQ